MPDDTEKTIEEMKQEVADKTVEDLFNEDPKK